jgi:hypothetical protein
MQDEPDAADVGCNLLEYLPVEKVSGTLGLSGAADTFLILDRDKRKNR